jgi:hypothetical protein
VVAQCFLTGGVEYSLFEILRAVAAEGPAGRTDF